MQNTSRPNEISKTQKDALPADVLRTLKNTYMLLAILMLPTIGGAWAAMQLPAQLMLAIFSGTIGMLAYLAVSFALIYLVHKNKNSGAGIAFLLAFSALVGAFLAPLLTHVLAMQGGMQIVMLAFSGTAMTLAGMSFLASVIKRDLRFMGKFLFVGLIMLLVASIGNIFFKSSALDLTLSVISCGLFSAYMLYDIKMVRDGHQTNYVIAALSIYLDMINLFVSLLRILSARK